MELVHTLLLNPAVHLTAVVALALLWRTQTPLLWLLNPWALDALPWLGGWLFVRVALLGFVDGLVWVVAPRLSKLPSRIGPKPVFQHSINSTDWAYLAINSTIEYVFALQIARLLWFAPFIVRAPVGLGVLNGPVAVWLLLVVDDMLYAPLHRCMHWPPLYRYVHKHHHRNTFPARGYIDAANEHPVEQIAALTLHWIAVHAVAATAGLHVGAVGAHFALKAMGACFNHTGIDVRFAALGIDYSVRAHEIHHRVPNKNFAQYVMFWDRLMGTFKPYESGWEGKAGAARPAHAAAAPPAGLAQAARAGAAPSATTTSARCSSASESTSESTSAHRD